MQLKRFLSFCVAILMIAATVIPLSATENETFEVGVEVGTETPISSNPQIIKSGDEVSVRIFATKNTGVSFVSFELYFDTDAFQLKSVTDNGLFGKSSMTIGQNENGFIRYFLDTSKTIVTTTGLLFEAIFTSVAEFDGNAEFSASIRSEKNCAKYATSSTNSYVPFVGDSASVAIHHITDAGSVTDPTCTEDGYTSYICTKCDEPIIGNIVPATGHSLKDIPAKAPTCTEIGWDAYQSCENCDYTTYVELPATGHSLVDHEAKAPTCTEIGWDAYQTCENCDYTTYVELPATGHSLVDHEAKAPTCTEIGWDAYQSCENCDYTTYVELPATGAHTGGTATCTNKAVCDVCGNEYGDVAADNHTGNTEIRDAIEATIEADGYTGDTYCKDCGVKLAEGEVIPKLTTPGDANSDGKVNIADVSLILKKIAGWEVSLDDAAADVTGDDKVNLADVSLILKYIAGWDVVLGN